MVNNAGGIPASLRSQAHGELVRGELASAEQSFTRLLDAAPNDVEALQFISTRYMDRGESGKAIDLLSAAHRQQPNDGNILHHLGAAQMVQHEMQAAVVTLKKCLEHAPHLFTARLRLGIALEQTGCPQEALFAYSSAIRIAQGEGRWLTNETTALALRDTVLHAIRYVNKGRKDLFQAVIEPLRQRYGRSDLVRVERGLAIYLGEQPANVPDARQQPKFFYFPDIPSQPYYPRERFPWMDELEAGTIAIRDELFNVLQQAQNLESFLQTDAPQGAAELLTSSSGHEPAWDAYFFHRHGDRYEAHCVQCPQTAALLDSLPLAYVREHSPETLYSVLRPGTHILPHYGVTNTRLVTHLPLVVPSDCALRVGGEMHVWQEGRCVTFDDTFEHEAWNKSDQTRVVLIVDSWNPDLSEAERAAVAELVGVIGDFNRACER